MERGMSIRVSGRKFPISIQFVRQTGRQTDKEARKRNSSQTLTRQRCNVKANNGLKGGHSDKNDARSLSFLLPSSLLIRLANYIRNDEE